MGICLKTDMLIPPYPFKFAPAGIRVTSEILNIQPYRCEGQPKRWRASFPETKIGPKMKGVAPTVESHGLRPDLL
jgi:hypothetical protein